MWSSSTKLFFQSSDGASRIINNCSSCSSSIEVTSLDLEFTQEPINFIKFDVEGAEYEALLGSKDIINKNKPILDVCVYHKPMDIINLPLLLKELCPYGNL